MRTKSKKQRPEPKKRKTKIKPIASQKQLRKTSSKPKVKPKATPKAKKSKAAIASEKQSKVKKVASKSKSKAKSKTVAKKVKPPSKQKSKAGKVEKAKAKVKARKGKVTGKVGKAAKPPVKSKKPVVKPKKKKSREGVPKGFTPFEDLITQNSALDIINDRLEATKAALPSGYAATVRVHAYADGSVDGELYINLLRSEVDAETADFDLQDAFTFLTLGDRYWVAVGARYELKTDDERYRRYKGMTQVQTNFQRATQTNIAEVHVVLRNAILPGMHKKFGVDEFSIYVRLNWNPANEQPKR